MKTKTLILALLFAVSTFSIALGNDSPQMTVVSLKGSTVFKVIYKGDAVGKVKLNIFDADGKMIHSESIYGQKGFIRPLNFKGLASGAYTIELIDGGGSHQEKVSYLPASGLKAIHVSKLPGREAKYLLAIANVQHEPIAISIYDDGNRLIYSESKVIKGDFAQVYSMDGPAKRYRFEISDAAGNKKYFTF